MQQLYAVDRWGSKLTTLAFTTRRSIHRSRSSGARAAIVLCAVLTVAPALVLAETQVRGNPQSVTLTVKNSSIAEILAVLGDRFGVRYSSSTNLEKRLSGTYTGTLQQVV